MVVVAPYNAHVHCLLDRLPRAVRVGTVDKFQGQEAPVVFYSMASSSADDVPRGLDFLCSRNRLNVAISRAQCLAYLVANPRPWTQTAAPSSKCGSRTRYAASSKSPNKRHGIGTLKRGTSRLGSSE